MTFCELLYAEYDLEYLTTGRKHPWKYNFFFCGDDDLEGRFRADNRKGIEECLDSLVEVGARHVILMNELSQLLWTSDDGFTDGLRHPKYLDRMLEGWRNDG